MEDTNVAVASRIPDLASSRSSKSDLIVVLIAAVIFLGCAFSPPHLMDDVDSVQAQIARNMLQSGDWVTARLDGVPYLEKSPLNYWLVAGSFAIFGIHDWAGRLPLALMVVTLCWVTLRFGRWAFGGDAGFYSGLVLSTSIGLFLFTRILIPDAILTLTITLAMWCFLRALEPDERNTRVWATLLAVFIGAGFLLKGLIAIVFPSGAAFVYLAVTRQLFSREAWRRLRPFSGALIVLLIASPWVVLATLRNPPFFEFTLRSGPGQYHGFFWFYFMNEHVLRFLNLRYPRDYNTVPRLLFWSLHLVWLFPWSFYFPAVARLGYKPVDRAGRTRLLALCWAGFVMTFFSFSTTQEYYSLPIYPAFALLLGAAMVSDSLWIRRGTKAVGLLAASLVLLIAGIIWKVWSLPTPGDISSALVQHPELYTLSLGHMGDLTMKSFAYLRLPLMLAGVAVLIGAIGIARYSNNQRQSFFAMAAMMVVFFHAARLAMIAFDPYLSSKPLADALASAPPGKLIEADAYYAFSSVFFYTNRQALLWNGRRDNLEYGSYAPTAPHVFIGDPDFRDLWLSDERYYLLADHEDLPYLQELVGAPALHIVSESGGKYLLANRGS
ncbi:MAG TPA: glycosyltransferase family 39 protein [Terriglobia bacterium]|nr:glycosyltransferase family 39 protein [Terriglobia bacterium]